MKLRFLIVLLLSGCAADGVVIDANAPERHYTGVVDNVQKTTRPGAPRASLVPLMIFGAIGGAMYAAATAGQPTNVHVVRFDSGKTTAVVTDEEFSPGDCVRIIARDASAEPLPWYSYGTATMERCRPQ